MEWGNLSAIDKSSMQSAINKTVRRRNGPVTGWGSHESGGNSAARAAPATRKASVELRGSPGVGWAPHGTTPPGRTARRQPRNGHRSRDGDATPQQAVRAGTATARPDSGRDGRG